jgi:hypothetical protein
VQDEFKELLKTDDRDRKGYPEAVFMEKIADKLNSTDIESALKVAASYDRFKKKAEQAGEIHLRQLF